MALITEYHIYFKLSCNQPKCLTHELSCFHCAFPSVVHWGKVTKSLPYPLSLLTWIQKILYFSHTFFLQPFLIWCYAYNRYSSYLLVLVYFFIRFHCFWIMCLHSAYSNPAWLIYGLHWYSHFLFHVICQIESVPMHHGKSSAMCYAGYKQ